jgi:hypothetical protein
VARGCGIGVRVPAGRDACDLRALAVRCRRRSRRKRRRRDPAGDVVASWTSGDGGELRGAVRPAGGTFTEPLRLSAEGADTLTANGPHGTGLIVFDVPGFDAHGRPCTAWYAAATSSGGVAEPRRLLRTTGESPGGASDPSGPSQTAAAIGPGGSAIVAFPYVPHDPGVAPTTGKIAVFAGCPGHLARSATLGVAPHDYPQNPKLAIDRDGRPRIAWTATPLRPRGTMCPHRPQVAPTLNAVRDRARAPYPRRVVSCSSTT